MKHTVVSSSSEPQGLVPFGACLDRQQQKTQKFTHINTETHTHALSLGKRGLDKLCLTNTHFPESPLCPNVERCEPTGQRGRAVAGSNPRDNLASDTGTQTSLWITVLIPVFPMTEQIRMGQKRGDAPCGLKHVPPETEFKLFKFESFAFKN